MLKLCYPDIMEFCSIDDLKTYSHELDLYERVKKPDEELLRLNLYPPLPVSGNILIWGHALLEKAEKAGIKECVVARFPGMKRHALLLLSLRCEARSGNYSWDEKERIIRYAGEGEKLYRELVILIEGRDDPSFIERMQTYMALQPSLKECVRRGYIDIKTALFCKGLPDDVFSLLLREKGRKRFSFAEIRVLLDACADVIKRDRLIKEEIVNLFEEVITSEDPVSFAKRKRFPQLSHLKDRFRSIKDEVVRGTGISLQQPPYFEGDAYSVSFSFTSKKNLSRKIRVLKKLEERSDELFELL
jgi:hypothetical protein